MRCTIPVLLVLLGAAGVLPGCQSSRNTEGVSLGLEATDRTAYYDVPVPLGFKETFDPLAYQAYKPVRSAYLHYKGGSYYLDVARFYFDSLPEQGWKFERQDFSISTIYLHYSKGNETLSLTIYAATSESQVIIKLIHGPATDDDD